MPCACMLLLQRSGSLLVKLTGGLMNVTRFWRRETNWTSLDVCQLATVFQLYVASAARVSPNRYSPHRSTAPHWGPCACSTALWSHSTSTCRTATLSCATAPRTRLPKLRRACTCELAHAAGRGDEMISAIVAGWSEVKWWIVVVGSDLIFRHPHIRRISKNRSRHSVQIIAQLLSTSWSVCQIDKTCRVLWCTRVRIQRSWLDFTPSRCWFFFFNMVPCGVSQQLPPYWPGQRCDRWCVTLL